MLMGKCPFTDRLSPWLKLINVKFVNVSPYEDTFYIQNAQNVILT